jgi:hypothetical protein
MISKAPSRSSTAGKAEPSETEVDVPKEITHWIVARRVAERLPAGALADAVRANRSSLLLGSIFHDVAYYGRGRTAYLVELADRLHGARGEDTHALLRALAPRADPIERPWLAAFLVGLLTHVVADSRLHPLVYYFTGNYYDRDRARQAAAAEAHRALEVVIDLRVAGGLAAARRHSLRRIVNGLEVPLPELLGEVASGLEGEASSSRLAADLAAALAFFSRVQRWIRRQALVRAFQTMSPLLPRSIAKDLALAYFPRLQRLTARFDRSLSYRNPLTGEPVTDRLDRCLDEIVETSIERCRRFPAGIAGDGPGPSLEVGVPEARTVESRYFHPLVLADDHRRVTTLKTLEIEEEHES